MSKVIHFYRPHFHICTNGREIHRLTSCGTENKGAYRSTTHAERVTCQRCLAAIAKAIIKKYENEEPRK